MAQMNWRALESLPEIGYQHHGGESWEWLRQRAIGASLAREACLPYLAGPGGIGCAVGAIADLTR